MLYGKQEYLLTSYSVVSTNHISLDAKWLGYII